MSRPGGSFGRGVAELARRLQQPIVIGLAAGAAAQMGRGARERRRGILARELEIDVGVEDPLDGRAAGVALSGGYQAVELARAIRHGVIASSSITGYPARARRSRRLRRASNRFL